MKLNLAILFDQEIFSGGGYQQSLNAALLAKDLSNNMVNIKFFTTKKKYLNTLMNLGIEAKFINLSIFNKLIIFLKSSQRYKFFGLIISIFFFESILEKKLKKYKIDIIYFLSPSVLAFDLDKLNYIYTIWDISHRDDNEFPEVRSKNEF